jgi:hypothetical protein
MRRAGLTLCALLVPAASLFGGGAATAASTQDAPPLTLISQSPWVTPAQPWFNLDVAVGESGVPTSQLHVSLTFYGRLDNGSQLQQALGGVPQKGVLGRVSDVAVTGGAGGRSASACVTVVPNEASSSTVPVGGPGACGADAPTLVLGCTPGSGRCGDVYPVSVALLRSGSSSPIERFTTFLTYQEPGAVGDGGPLRVAVVVPATTDLPTVAGALTDQRNVPTTVAVSPVAVQQAEQQRTRADTKALGELADLGGDGTEVLDQPYVPINVAALSGAGIAGEISAQLARGGTLLREAGLHPVADSPWIDTSSDFTQGDGPNLANGMVATGSPQLVLSDADLTSGGLANYTFAQPFTLDLGRGSVPAAAANSQLSARFTAHPDDPRLGAEQLLASLSWVHFEDAFLADPRGVVVIPPPGWRPSGPFLETLLSGLSGNPALSSVTLSQLFSVVQPGGNREPGTRRLQAGPAGRGITKSAADKIALGRLQLSSYSAAAEHPAELAPLSDALLATEGKRLSTSGRAAALAAYGHAFAGEVGKVSLGTERTVTFTSGRAPIPITVLSAAGYPVRVVLTLNSDKFTFPNGNTRTLTLSRPTTSVRIEAQARTSGDRLPIDVTLRTPDGQLLIARTVLTVHSTAISFVGVALTVLAGVVLAAWWIRTWRRSRRGRLRAHAAAKVDATSSTTTTSSEVPAH